MEISDWVLVGSVIVALVLGIRSLRQTKDLRRKEYRHKLLDEIIDWAKDTIETSFLLMRGLYLTLETITLHVLKSFWRR